MKGIKKIWSPEEEGYLIKNFANEWNSCLAKHCNCSPRTVIRKARELGLEKTADFRDHIDFSQFGKGQKPWNKGMKGKVLSPGCEKTWFKPGTPSIMKDPEVVKRVHEKRNKTIRTEKLRLRNGLDPKTKLNLKNFDYE